MTVLLAYIRTPEGDAALAVALQEAQLRSTDALVVNVTRPVAEIDSPLSAEQTLDGVATMFQNAGVAVEIRQLPASTDRAGDIIAVISEAKPELAVIGMRRHRTMGGRIVGSTAQRILRDAECPVLMVKAPADAPDSA